MQGHIQIGAKTLGELALDHYCPRCFWLKMDRKGHIPFDTFPSIFSVIDRFTKNAIHNYFDEQGAAPPCLSGMGKLVGYEKPPKSSWFRLYDEDTDITLTGEPDALFRCENDSFVIGDYKTAREHDDPLLPMYHVQLTCYALLAEYHDYKPISGIHLIYAEPLSSTDDVKADFTYQEDGIALGFRIKTKPLPLDTTIIPPLLKQVREIMSHDTCPPGTPGCRNCANVDALAARSQIITPEACHASQRGFTNGRLSVPHPLAVAGYAMAYPAAA